MPGDTVLLLVRDLSQGVMLRSLVESDKRMEPSLHLSGINVVRDTLVPKLDIQAVGLLLSQFRDISTCCTYSWIKRVSLVILSIMVSGLKMLLGQGGVQGVREARDHIVMVEPKDSSMGSLPPLPPQLF